MVVGSRSSMRRNLRGAEPSLQPSTQNSSRTREESLKRTLQASINDPERLKKRRKLIRDVKVAQLRIPLRGRKLVSPRVVTQSFDQSQASTPSISSPQTQYDQIRKIEKEATVAIRGGVWRAFDEKRHLRSQDGGSRSKSELAQYFPNYEQMLSLDPVPSEPFNAETKLTIVDDTPSFQPRPPTPSDPRSVDPFGAHKPLSNAVRVDLLKMSTGARRQLGDPLGPDHFIKVHKKEERREKQIRNNEKEKAQHEKYQLERLVAELRGPDWLRTMGISGITDTEKKRYEPKRVQFVLEIRGMIDKYEAWKVKEKQQKLRELELAATGAEEESDADDEAEVSDDQDDQAIIEESTEPEDDAESSVAAKSESVDIDALAAQQLIQEAQDSSQHRPRKKRIPDTDPRLPDEPPPYRPFTSFYDKRHLRDAALGSHGRRSRGITAFGQPIPEIEEREFELPSSIATLERIRASRRRARRANRATD